MQRFISIILTVLMITSTLSLGTLSFSAKELTSNENNVSASEKYVLGDADLSKTIDIKDVTVIQKYLANMKDFQDTNKICADVDKNERISIKDASYIQRYILNIETEGINVGEEFEYSPVEPTTPTEATTLVPTTVTQPQTEATTQIETTETTVPPTTATQTTEVTTVAPTTATQTIEATTVAPTTATQPTEVTTVAPTTQSAVSNDVTIYFTNNYSFSNVYFYIYNTASDTPLAQWPGQKISNYTTNEYGEKIYSMTIDVSKWNRIIFNDGNTQQTVNTPLTKASSGFYIQSGSGSALMPGTYANTGADGGTIKTTSLQYSTGYTKKIWIWTPAGYTTTKKYKTIYLMDGQNLFDADHSDSFGGWEVTDAVESLMANGGEGYILVGIDNGNSKRDSELTPDIGNVKSQYQSEFASRTGDTFSKFVANTVMPYVQSNYSSSTLASDNAIMGSSSGGLEAFYIGMENMDKFGNIGALSPAFALFNDSVWDSYLSKFDLTASTTPRLYIYNGNNDSTEQELYDGTISLYNKLKTAGYDSDKITLVLEEGACHNEGYWRIIFPEALCFCYQP